MTAKVYAAALAFMSAHAGAGAGVADDAVGLRGLTDSIRC